MVDTPSLDDDLDISAPEDSLPPLGLDDLPELMREACSRAGWTRLMPVQAHSLPYLLAGRDMMIQSRTGSRQNRGLPSAPAGPFGPRP